MKYWYVPRHQPCQHYAQWKQPVTKDQYCVTPLHAMPQRGKSTEVESRSGLQSKGVEGRWGVAADGYAVSLRGNKYILKLDSSNGYRGHPRWCSGKESACQCRRGRKLGFSPRSGSSPGVGTGNPLQYPCLWNPMDRGAWWALVHGVAESDAIEHAHTHTMVIEVLIH